jgi:hypothetical protein
MDPGGLPTDSQADTARPWLAPIVAPPPPPPPRRRRPWFIGLGVGVTVVCLVVAVVWSTGSDADEEPVLVTVLREAGQSQSVTMNRRVTIDRVGTVDQNTFCDVRAARCTFEAVEGTWVGTYIVDGIALAVWMDPTFIRSIGGPDTGQRWGVTPLREVTDIDLWRFGQGVLFGEVLRMARLGEWQNRSFEDGVGTQRIVVTADDLALADTDEEFLGTVTYLDRTVLTFEFDSDRLLMYTMEYGSDAGAVKEEYTIIGFDLKPTIEVPDDAVPIPGSLFDR